jgi:acyl dehydratase
MVNLDSIGEELEPMEYEYTWKEVILYALGIGAGNDDLTFTYENGLRVYPTFAVIPAFFALTSIVEKADLDMTRLLHAGQKIVLHREIPTSGRLLTKGRITEIFDTGKHSVTYADLDTRDEKGDVLFTNTFAILVLGDGGFGGKRPPEVGNKPPEKEPDFVDETEIPKNQNLIYRLSGDLNPLHVDPDFARMVGYSSPILHGLCTFGFAGRSILKKICDNDPGRLKSFEVRFSNVVYPGDTIITEGWSVGGGKHVVRTRNQRGEVVLSHGSAEVR